MMSNQIGLYSQQKYVNETIIKEYWDDILRLVTTIKLKETSALNSYSKQHKLYQALKSFGQIIKSDFILRYIDDVALRQAIEKQLNKIELANRFTRAIVVGNPRELTQGDKEEQEIPESCNRLIKNSICWNYLYLSQKLERMDNPVQKDKLLSAISSHSLCHGHTPTCLVNMIFQMRNLKILPIPKNCKIINTNKGSRQNHYDKRPKRFRKNSIGS